MKILLAGINAKYIHPNMAIRLLKANTSFPMELKEWTIKDKPEAISQYILENNYELVGISVYIWNIEIVKEVLKILKEDKFRGLIVLGGPEVSYENDYLFNNYNVDYIIINEGEEAFDLLLNALKNKTSLENIPNLIGPNFKNPLQSIENLDKLNTAFFDLDYINQIIYIETSRGCPFKCSYCMASLEDTVRYFDLNEIKKTLLFLFNQEAKTFKFLDRTFNTKTSRVKDLFSFIMEHAPENASFQFEIVGDLLGEDLIEFINTKVRKGLIRFEIGIQTTNDRTNFLIGRKQNNELLFKNIKALQDGNIVDLHLDLIAGLPDEDLTSFKKSFNDVIALRPLELQLGFLKLLKGTRLYNEARKYNYKWSSRAPYEISETGFLKNTELDIIQKVEKVCEKYYNSAFMRTTINYILDSVDSAFDFFADFGIYYENSFSWFAYNLHDLFIRLSQYIQNHTNLEYELILFSMKQDYLKHFNIKPSIWWERLKKEAYRQKVKELSQTKLKDFKIEDIFRYGLVEEYQDKGFLIMYKPNKKIFYMW